MLYFNTEPRWGAIIPGMTVALEEAYAVDPDSGIDGNTITEIKTALMGPLAGIGDTVWAGLMKPIFLSITLAWAMDGHVSVSYTHLDVYKSQGRDHRPGSYRPGRREKSLRISVRHLRF